MGKLAAMLFVILSLYTFADDLKLEKTLVLNQIEQIKQKDSWPEKKIVLIAGAAALSAYCFDENIEKWAKRYPEDGGYSAMRSIFNGFGSKEVLVLPAGCYAFGTITENEKLKAASFTSLESVFTASCFTIAIKSVIGRERPENEKGAYDYKPFNVNDAWNSMPSGHSTAAWAVFTPFAVYYDNKWIYIIPAGVSIARVVSDKHWASDVIAGGIIGYTVGYFMSHKNSEKIEFTGSGFKIKF